VCHQSPCPPHTLSDAFLDIPALVDSEMEKSSDAAAELMARFEKLARKAGVYQDRIIHKCYGSEAPDLLVREARLRDLTILSAVSEDYNYPWYAESVIFGSGRPILVLPPQAAREFALYRAVVAWDGSRPASRAVADALPLLEHAREVQVLTVLKEKKLSSKSPARELTQYSQAARHRCQPRLHRCCGPNDRRSSDFRTTHPSSRPLDHGRIRPLTHEGVYLGRSYAKHALKSAGPTFSIALAVPVSTPHRT
jgi:hypothetical protein